MRAIPFLIAGLLVSGCASSPTVQSQKYAKLSTQQTLEDPMEKVYPAVEEALRNIHVAERNPDEKPNAVEMQKLTEATWETDWVYSQSQNKYIEYKVNGFPRKKYLQLRVKYHVVAKTEIGGTHVEVKAQEEVERLAKDGTPDGWDSAGEPDTALGRRMLDQVAKNILAAAP